MSDQDLREAITPSHGRVHRGDFEMLFAEIEDRLRVYHQEQARKDAYLRRKFSKMREIVKRLESING